MSSCAHWSAAIILILGATRLAAQPEQRPQVKLTAAQVDMLNLRNKYVQEAIAEKKAGHPREAVLLFQKAIPLTRVVFGVNTAEAAPILDAMADLHHDMGQWESARDMRRQVYDLLSTAKGVKEWRVFEAKNNLEEAELFIKMSDADRKDVKRAEARWDASLRATGCL
jgi:hypothetical protein